MHKLSGSCNQCGMCCKAIVLPISYDELKERDAVKYYINGARQEDIENNDVLFVWLNWKPLTKEEAFGVNPYLKKIDNNADDPRDVEWHPSFWTCTKHDPITNKCTVHDNQPDVCSKFPWYGREVHSRDIFYTAECGYKIDVIQAQNLLKLEEEKKATLDDPECLDETVEENHD